MQLINNKNKILELMAQGATVVTPNNRLSASLLRDYFQFCTTTTVDKPICLPINTFLSKTYQQLTIKTPNIQHKILMNTAQCQHLWRQLLQQESSYTYNEGLLAAVMEAWEFCQNWNITDDDPAFSYTPQTRQFQIWWQKINQQLQQLNLLAEQQIIGHLITAPINVCSKILIWTCFDSFTPLQQSLQNYLQQQCVVQYSYDIPTCSHHQTKVFPASDIKEEYQQLITWLQHKLQQGEEHIAVVVPDLQNQGLALERLMQKHFAPDQYDISLGHKLADYPIIAHAQTWLQLDNKKLSPEQATLLLQSPYCAFAKEEFVARSELLQNAPLIQVQTLQSQCPKLADCLYALKPYPQDASVQEWITIFQERLNGIGFPGDYGLDSVNYQAYQRLIAVFDEFRQLAKISGKLSAIKALEAFSHLLHNTIFQAQKTNAAIQISGLLEASGCEFDNLWVTGLTDKCLPQPTRLSAFIPAPLQRSLEMPHSLPAKELTFAQQTLSRLVNGSKNLVFSYPLMSGDTPNLACTLIKDFPLMQALTIKEEKSTSELAVFEEQYQLPVIKDEPISGGTRILENQAQCPFKAFAEHRLHAEPMLEAEEGLTNIDKGLIIHKVMELFWKKVHSQQQLLQLSHDELDDIIATCIKNALSYIPNLNPIVYEIECTRLQRLVHACLEWERTRDPFTVKALEEKFVIELAHMKFNVRVDRLDQVGENQWVIDYKSSLPSTKPWFEERAMAPQLLLYALLDARISTLILLQLKTGKFSCSLFGADEEPEWDERRELWRQQLEGLALEFQSGHCLPSPLKNDLCNRCEFGNLCRYSMAFP